MRKHYNITKTVYGILIVLLICSLLSNIVMSVQANSLAFFIKEVVFDGNMKRVFLVTGLDHFLGKLNPPGNIVLKFNGFKQIKKGDADNGPLVIYFRSVYYLYPRKVFTVPPDVKVNNGEDILANAFNPNMHWMQSHGVSTVISINKASNGNIYHRVHNIPYPSHQRNNLNKKQ